jgi:hypothetical protein
MESAFPSQNLWKDPCKTFIRMDGVLLEVHNQKEECCAWSLVATISHILALKLTASLRLLVRSFSLSCQSIAWLSWVVLHIVHSRPSVLLGSRLSSSLIAVVLWVLACNHSILIAPLYRQILPNTHHGVRWPSSHVVMISSCLHVSILFGYRREGHLRSCWGLIQFGSSYLDGWGCPRHWNLRNFFFLSELPLELLNQEDWVIRRHTSRVMKRNHILQGAMSPTHRRKGGMGDQEVLLHLTILISSFLHDQCALHYFLCFPPHFINLRTRFLLRGKCCNTLCFVNPNQVT